MYKKKWFKMYVEMQRTQNSPNNFEKEVKVGRLTVATAF